MNHYLVDIDAEKLRLADYSDEREQLLGVACRLNNQDTELQTVLFELKRNSRVLADEIPIPIDPKTVIVFEATLTPSGEVVAAINGYVFWVEPRKLQILAGSGLYGSKNTMSGGFTEIRIIRDVKFHEGEIYLIDQTIPKGSNRPVLQLKKRGF